MIRHPREWTDPFQKKVITFENSCIREKLVLWYETSQGQRESRETAGEIICSDSK